MHWSYSADSQLPGRRGFVTKPSLGIVQYEMVIKNGTLISILTRCNLPLYATIHPRQHCQQLRDSLILNSQTRRFVIMILKHMLTQITRGYNCNYSNRSCHHFTSLLFIYYIFFSNCFFLLRFYFCHRSMYFKNSGLLQIKCVSAVNIISFFSPKLKLLFCKLKK